MAKNKESATSVEVLEEEHDEDLPEDELELRREQRQNEWGQQFHKWLINAARKGKVVELLLSVPYPGISKDGNIVTGIPKRVDKDFVQVVVEKVEVWLQLDYVIGCKHVGSPAKTLAEND